MADADSARDAEQVTYRVVGLLSDRFVLTASRTRVRPVFK